MPKASRYLLLTLFFLVILSLQPVFGATESINASADGAFLWLMNIVNCDQEVKVFLNEEKIAVTDVELYRGNKAIICGSNCVSAFVKGRDATIVTLL